MNINKHSPDEIIYLPLHIITPMKLNLTKPGENS